MIGIGCQCVCHTDLADTTAIKCCICRYPENHLPSHQLWGSSNRFEISTNTDSLVTRIEKLEKLEENSTLSRARLIDDIKIIDSHINSLFQMGNTFGERIQKLDEAYKADFEVAKELIFAGAQTHASILKLTKRIEELEDNHINLLNQTANINVKQEKLRSDCHETLYQKLELIREKLEKNLIEVREMIKSI